MNVLSRVRWLRVLAGGFLAEVVLIVIAVPVWFIPAVEAYAPYFVIPLCLAATFVFGWWVGKGVESDFVLQGALVGVIAALLYIGIAWGQPLPVSYVVANYLKIVGGAAGGYYAARLQRAAVRRPEAPAV